jgi:hypothetical protein
MKKILLALLLVIGISSCKEAQVEDTGSTTQEHVDWDLDTSSYDAVDVDEVQEEYSQGNIEWIWDGSPYDTITIGDNLRITNIDGDKVYITLSK